MTLQAELQTYSLAQSALAAAAIVRRLGTSSVACEPEGRMANRDAAEVYGFILKWLAEQPPDPRVEALALEAWRRVRKQELEPSTLEADGALLKLGLAVRDRAGRISYPPREPRTYYFGVWKGSGGHLLRDAEGEPVDMRALPIQFRLARLDGGFLPPVDASPDERQPEGLAAIHQVAGWTVLSFFDRSGDARYGSHSTFLLEGTLAFEDAVEAARRAFPSVWARFKFQVHKHTLA